MVIGPSQVALLLAITALLALAGLIWMRTQRLHRRTGLPKGEVVYADTGAWQHCQPFYAPRYGLSGKPDYVVRSGGETIPVEVKPGRHATEPYLADTMQLAAYCLLLEEATGRRPSHGLLCYQGSTFRIPFQADSRAAVLDTLEAMRRGLRQEKAGRSHSDPQRCRFCGHCDQCEERLP